MRRILKSLGLAAGITLSAASAQALTTVTISGPTPVNPGFHTPSNAVTYVVDLLAAGFQSVTSVRLVDDGNSPLDANPGFDVDGIGLFATAPTGPLTNTAAPTTFNTFSIGTAAAANFFNGSVVTGGFFPIGNGGALVAAFTSALTIVPGNQFLVIQDAGAVDFLSSIEITGTVIPLPAGAVLLITGLGGLALLRRRIAA